MYQRAYLINFDDQTFKWAYNKFPKSNKEKLYSLLPYSLKRQIAQYSNNSSSTLYIPPPEVKDYLKLFYLPKNPKFKTIKNLLNINYNLQHRIYYTYASYFNKKFATQQVVSSPMYKVNIDIAWPFDFNQYYKSFPKQFKNLLKQLNILSLLKNAKSPAFRLNLQIEFTFGIGVLMKLLKLLVESNFTDLSILQSTDNLKDFFLNQYCYNLLDIYIPTLEQSFKFAELLRKYLFPKLYAKVFWDYRIQYMFEISKIIYPYVFDSYLLYFDEDNFVKESDKCPQYGLTYGFWCKSWQQLIKNLYQTSKFLIEFLSKSSILSHLLWKTFRQLIINSRMLKLSENTIYLKFKDLKKSKMYKIYSFNAEDSVVNNIYQTVSTNTQTIVQQNAPLKSATELWPDDLFFAVSRAYYPVILIVLESFFNSILKKISKNLKYKEKCKQCSKRLRCIMNPAKSLNLHKLFQDCIGTPVTF